MTRPDSAYATLERDSHLPLDLMVQRVPAAETGLHVDIETDDVEAEVRRLERLGARRKRQVKSWWVMEDPAGHAFCVVRVQHKEDWPQGAVEWKERDGAGGEMEPLTAPSSKPCAAGRRRRSPTRSRPST